MSINSSNLFPAWDLLKAVNFAAIKHTKQKRKDLVTPYINHPIGVAWNLVNIGKVHDLVVLQAAILHDTVEDTECSLDEIEAEFGQHVRSVVAEVTDDKSLPKAERKRLQVVHAAHLSREAKLVKLADKLYNIRELLDVVPIGWDQDQVLEYVAWGKQVVSHLRGVNAPLEAALDDVFSKHDSRAPPASQS